MPNNTFGHNFVVTTFGESHGPYMGCVIDGCPAGLELSEKEISGALERRAPGRTPWTSPRKEPDTPRIISGLFEGKTTGAPLTILIKNRDVDSSKYAPIKDLVRPGHADGTYRLKYGHIDWRGGGRASARETVCRVAAGAIAAKLIPHIDVHAYLKNLGPIESKEINFEHLETSPLFCPDPAAEKEMQRLIERAGGDSYGGVVGVYAEIPPGLGEPVYRKLEAKLAYAMLSIPASKGFEIGSGFAAAKMRGSEHNDEPVGFCEEGLKTRTNYAGGVLGGISTGMPLEFRVAFKPTSSISTPQKTTNLEGSPEPFELPKGSRHDPAVCIRAVPVVEAMTSLVLADLSLTPVANVDKAPGLVYSHLA
jgi:chorismate synthase